MADELQGAPGLDEGSRPDPEALLEARLRNAARTQDLRGELLADALSGRQLAAKLGVSVQAVDQARRADKVIALRQGGSWRYPFWQLDLSAPDPVPPHLPELAKASGGLRLAVVQWLRERDDVLGETPLEALRSHRWQDVVRRARQLAPQPVPAAGDAADLQLGGALGRPLRVHHRSVSPRPGPRLLPKSPAPATGGAEGAASPPLPRVTAPARRAATGWCPRSDRRATRAAGGASSAA